MGLIPTENFLICSPSIAVSEEAAEECWKSAFLAYPGCVN